MGHLVDRRTRLSLLVLTTGLLGFAPIGLQGQSAQLSLGAQILEPDGTTQVPIKISSGGVPLAAVQFQLAYDNSVLSLLGVAGKSATDGIKAVYQASTGFGERFVIAGINSNPIPDGILLNLVITRARTPAGGVFPLYLSKASGTGLDGAAAISLSVSGGTTSPPVIQPVSLVTCNGASFQAGAVAPGEFLAIFAAGMLPPDATASNVTVTFNGNRIPLVYVGTSQVNVIAPFGVANVSSIDASVIYSGQVVGKATIPIVKASPAIFSTDSSGMGQGAVLNQDSSVNSAANPAAPGTTVSLFSTGAGTMSPALNDGQITPPGSPALPVLPVALSVGGGNALIAYAGPAPGLPAGLLQVNFVVPSGLPPGNVPLQLTVGSFTGPAGITMAVQ